MVQCTNGRNCYIILEIAYLQLSASSAVFASSLVAVVGHKDIAEKKGSIIGLGN